MPSLTAGGYSWTAPVVSLFEQGMWLKQDTDQDPCCFVSTEHVQSIWYKWVRPKRWGTPGIHWLISCILFIEWPGGDRWTCGVFGRRHQQGERAFLKFHGIHGRELGDRRSTHGR